MTSRRGTPSRIGPPASRRPPLRAWRRRPVRRRVVPLPARCPSHACHPLLPQDQVPRAIRQPMLTETRCVATPNGDNHPQDPPDGRLAVSARRRSRRGQTQRRPRKGPRALRRWPPNISGGPRVRPARDPSLLAYARGAEQGAYWRLVGLPAHVRALPIREDDCHEGGSSLASAWMAYKPTATRPMSRHVRARPCARAAIPACVRAWRTVSANSF